MGGRNWSGEEIRALREMYPTQDSVAVAKFLHRSLNSVLIKANRLRLRKTGEYNVKKGTESGLRSIALRGDKIWTEEDLAKLKEVYATTSTRELANIFKCTMDAIRGQAWLLGLHKNKKVLARAVGVKAHRLGEIGERLAEEFFSIKGWEILERGKNRGAGFGCSSFDFIVRTEQAEKFAVNVKHGKDMHLHHGTVRNLMRLPYRSAILYVTPSRQFFFMPIIPLTSGRQLGRLPGSA